MTATEPEVELPADLVERAMLLTTAGKQKLAGLLLKAVELPPDDPEVVRQEWNAVIADRLEGFLSGKYKAEDWRVSLARVEAAQLNDELVRQLLQLPAADRHELARALLVEADATELANRQDWREEIQHRWDEYESGKVQPLTAEGVLANLRNRASRRPMP